jgi:hypothetical protein
MLYLHEHVYSLSPRTTNVVQLNHLARGKNIKSMLGDLCLDTISAQSRKTTRVIRFWPHIEYLLEMFILHTKPIDSVWGRSACRREGGGGGGLGGGENPAAARSTWCDGGMGNEEETALGGWVGIAKRKGSARKSHRTHSWAMGRRICCSNPWLCCNNCTHKLLLLT